MAFLKTPNLRFGASVSVLRFPENICLFGCDVQMSGEVFKFIRTNVETCLLLFILMNIEKCVEIIKLTNATEIDEKTRILVIRAHLRRNEINI